MRCATSLLLGKLAVVRDGPTTSALVLPERALSVDEVREMARLLDRLLAPYDRQRHRPPMRYAEAAELLGVSVRYLQRRVREGSVPHAGVGVYVRFYPKHIEAIREGMERGSVPPPRTGVPDAAPPPVLRPVPPRRAS